MSDLQKLTADEIIDKAKQLQKERKNAIYEKIRKKFEASFVKISGGTVIGKGDKGVFTEGKTITIPSFYISKYETTQEEYQEIMEDQLVTVNGKTYSLSFKPSFQKERKEEKLPVCKVTWYDAVYYCNLLSEKTGRQKAYEIEVFEVDNYELRMKHITKANVTPIENSNGYRLPTEAEWEYAARGGNPDSPEWNYIYSGSDDFDEVGWFAENSDNKTHSVGQKQPNSLGLYDMSGNVFEWCYDLYNSSSRVERGGGAYDWGMDVDDGIDCAITDRNSEPPGENRYEPGFRVVRSAL